MNLRDDTLRGLRFYDNNKRIQFLPVKISEKFPNLWIISAFGGAIRSISKENFKGLRELRWLQLGHNQIVKVSDDTFEDLVSLEGLWLGK